MHAPECSGRIYGCPDCGQREMTIGETFDHKCSDAAVLLLDAFTVYELREHDKGSAHQIRHDADGNIVCPVCGHGDVAMWADDGEAWAADWWQCEKFSGGCGASGAVVAPHDHTKTQNGVEVGAQANGAQS